MIRQFGKYTAGLIALYLVVANSTGFGKAIAEGARGGQGIIRTLQGR